MVRQERWLSVCCDMHKNKWSLDNVCIRSTILFVHLHMSIRNRLELERRSYWEMEKKNELDRRSEHLHHIVNVVDASQVFFQHWTAATSEFHRTSSFSSLIQTNARIERLRDTLVLGQINCAQFNINMWWCFSQTRSSTDNAHDNNCKW